MLLGVLRILQQVVNHLAHLLGIRKYRQTFRIEFGPHRHRCIFCSVELQHVVDERVQVQRLQPGGRQPGVVAELVDQALHGIDLVNDRAHQTAQDFLLFLRQAFHELHLEPFGRKLDRRQRVLDFMREAAGHLSPRLDALGRNNGRYVFKHQQTRAGHLPFGQHGAPKHKCHDILMQALMRRRVELHGVLPVIARNGSRGRRFAPLHCGRIGALLAFIHSVVRDQLRRGAL